MNKKKSKKRKVKIIPMTIAVLIVFSFLLLLVYLISLDTKNIFIRGNNLLNDQVIIEAAKLEDYPAFYRHTTSRIAKNIKKLPLVKEVKVKRQFFHVFEITLIEKEILFYDLSKEVYVLDDESTLKENYEDLDYPILLNYISDVVASNFIKNYMQIDKNLRSRISEIRYEPNEYDQNRFLLSMNDGNYVYINIISLDLLKHYDSIYASLEGKKGILYCDSSYAEVCSFEKIP